MSEPPCKEQVLKKTFDFFVYLIKGRTTNAKSCSACLDFTDDVTAGVSRCSQEADMDFKSCAL